MQNSPVFVAAMINKHMWTFLCCQHVNKFQSPGLIVKFLQILLKHVHFLLQQILLEISTLEECLYSRLHFDTETHARVYLLNMGWLLGWFTVNAYFLFKNLVTTAGFRRSFRLSRKDRKTNKTMYECKKSDQYDTADVPTYEEVAKYRRQPNEKYRLVVLVGKF